MRELLQSHLDLGKPVLYIPHFEAGLVRQAIAAVAGERPVYYLNTLAPHRTQGSDVIPLNGPRMRELRAQIEHVQQDGDAPCFVVIEEAPLHWNNPESVGLIKAMVDRSLYGSGRRVTLFLLSNRLVIPPELQQLVTVVEVPHPPADEIAAIIAEVAAARQVSVHAHDAQALAGHLKGLYRYDIEQVVGRIIQAGLPLGEQARPMIRREKEQLIKRSGLLQQIAPKATRDDVGGLEHLTAWLERKSRIFRNLEKARAARVEIPRGILVAGMPGCGKSLSAHVAASLFDAPLLRLDLGSLMGKYLGESEHNLRLALQTAEAVSPCVLWLDEVEKGFAGVGESGGASDVTTRLLGYLLTWMQEKSAPVFVVATANDISKLPPELLRRGRFDELFAVTFPTARERRRILEIHLTQRNCPVAAIDTATLAEETADFAGADLAHVVQQAVENAFLDEKEQVTTADLQGVIAQTRSLKAAMAEKVTALQKILSEYEFKPASKGEHDGDDGVAPTSDSRGMTVKQLAGRLGMAPQELLSRLRAGNRLERLADPLPAAVVQEVSTALGKPVRAPKETADGMFRLITVAKPEHGAMPGYVPGVDKPLAPFSILAGLVTVGQFCTVMQRLMDQYGRPWHMLATKYTRLERAESCVWPHQDELVLVTKVDCKYVSDDAALELARRLHKLKTGESSTAYKLDVHLRLAVLEPALLRLEQERLAPAHGAENLPMSGVSYHGALLFLDQVARMGLGEYQLPTARHYAVMNHGLEQVPEAELWEWCQDRSAYAGGGRVEFPELDPLALAKHTAFRIVREG